MTITINLPDMNGPDDTIEAEHIILLTENGDSGTVSLKGRTCDDSLGQQLAGLFLTLKERRPIALWMALKYILSPGYRRHYHGRD